MIPPECYWPPEMLAQAMPERYGHLAQKESTPTTDSRVYSKKAVDGGCVVIRLQFGGEARNRALARRS